MKADRRVVAQASETKRYVAWDARSSGAHDIITLRDLRFLVGIETTKKNHSV